LAGAPGNSVYAATKFGLRGFALALREDLAPKGVGVSVILPGFRLPKHAIGAITLRGRLSYGLALRDGIASHLRLERARVSTTFSP